ncbi:hypothetical protein GYMLUDRAFT_248795 [Collybiopsis luxurians FD-317 M1]|uniref:Uncharacterized protein n=1 Tax=Collybiopsis luxurians FD-317 M1 TaxID=944289 RepID=A0A0D0BZ57_9AGAR|nr:hypothetical protein GYMLUDRAFT_248795 [Collybiopsis luxurians FD-317 M1]
MSRHFPAFVIIRHLFLASSTPFARIIEILRQMKRFVLPRPIFHFYPSSWLNSTQLVAWFIHPISYTDSRRSNSVRDTHFRNTLRNLLWAPACDDLQPPGDVANHPFHANANIIDGIHWSSPSGLNDPDTIAPDPAPQNLSIELLSVGARNDLLVKGPQDDVAGCLLKAKIIDRIPGGFQFRLNDPETVASFWKGIALGAASPDDCYFMSSPFLAQQRNFPQEPTSTFDLGGIPQWERISLLTAPPLCDSHLYLPLMNFVGDLPLSLNRGSQNFACSRPLCHQSFIGMSNLCGQSR